MKYGMGDSGSSFFFFFLFYIFLSDFETKGLNTRPSFLKFLLKFLPCNNTWK